MLLRHYRIRSLMYLGVTLLSLIVIALAGASFWGVWKFRKLTKDIRLRATELPLAAELGNQTNQLRAAMWACEASQNRAGRMGHPSIEHSLLREDLLYRLRLVVIALDMYEAQLQGSEEGDPRIVDTTQERGLVRVIHGSIGRIRSLLDDPAWELGNYRILGDLEEELERLQVTAHSIPSLLKERMDSFAVAARSEYHALIAIALIAGSIGLGLLLTTAWVFNRMIFRPLKELIRGSQWVASGHQDYRIRLDGSLEMNRLAEAFNHMTASFQAINENLVEQVEARSRELIRSEQLASVGMMAAGVAHEINNPLASIAWNAEALESRLEEYFPADGAPTGSGEAGLEVTRRYLVRIQEEAFRCKKITSGLLDFARLGDARKSPHEMRSIVASVVEMVRTLGRYPGREVVLHADEEIVCEVNSQEIRQVILNLVTNALDSTDTGGQVIVRLYQLAGECVVEVQDNGCGMTSEVLQNLFEPFFTRRRDGQGTGLGLAISWRIVDEHQGQIHVESGGPGKGSRFQLCLPLKQNANAESEKESVRAAA